MTVDSLGFVSTQEQSSKAIIVTLKVEAKARKSPRRLTQELL